MAGSFANYQREQLEESGEAPMATLNYQTPVVYFFYPITLGAGQTIEIGIKYFTGQQILSFLSVYTGSALGL
jgi:hypothetical protein